MVIEFVFSSSFPFPFDLTPPSLSFTAVVMNQTTFPSELHSVSVLQYMWLLDVREDKGGFRCGICERCRRVRTRQMEE